MAKHTATISVLIVIDVNKLIKLVKNKPVTWRKLSTLGIPNRSRSSGFRIWRYLETDIKYPLIIDTDNIVIDGRHRLCRLCDSGSKTAKVIVATDEELYACIIE